MEAFAKGPPGLLMGRSEVDYDLYMSALDSLGQVRLRSGVIGGSNCSTKLFLLALKAYRTVERHGGWLQGKLANPKDVPGRHRRSWLMNDDGMDYDMLTIVELAEREDGVMFSRSFRLGMPHWAKIYLPGHGEDIWQTELLMRRWCCWEDRKLFQRQLRNVHRQAMAERDHMMADFFGHMREQLEDAYQMLRRYG